MFHFIKQLSRKKWLAPCWTIATIVLLCLPGNAFPGGGLFHIPHLDKIVHIILFGGIVFWWVLFLDSRNYNLNITAGKITILVLSALLLGIILEFIQLNFIPNRDFDPGDIIANAAGSLLTGIVLIRVASWRRK